MWRHLKSPIVRISFGLAMLTVSMLFVTEFLGLVPNTERAELQSRQIVAESLAVQLSELVTSDNIASADSTLQSVVSRNDSVISGAIRLARGELLAVHGDHHRHWSLKPSDKSTSTQVQVPIYNEKGRWGSVEIRFSENAERANWLPVKSSFITVILFVALAGFVAYMFFLKRTMRELNPDSVIPERVRTALDTLAEGLLIVGKDGYIVFSNASFAHKTGLSPKELVGKEISSFKWRVETEGEDAVAADPPWISVLEDGKPTKSVAMKLNTGLIESYSFSVNVSPINAAAGKVRGVLITFDDVTEIESKNEELRHTLGKLEHSKREIMRQNQELEVLATRDPLTGVLNRRSLFQGFETLFAEAREEHEPLSCIMVDIDHFKSVNDRFGHAIGDKVIKLLATILTDYSRPNDLVGRFGGEEFCVVLPGADGDAAVEIAERMRQKVQHGEGIRFTNALRITSSFGVAEIESGVDGHNALVDRADKALYFAKENGRNRVVLYTALLEDDEAETESGSHETQAEPAGEETVETVELVQLPAESDVEPEAEMASETDGASETEGASEIAVEHADFESDLTRAPKRIILVDRIDQAMRRAQRYDTKLAILKIDIGTVQRVQDTLGHLVAEKVSREFVSRLKSLLRNVDTVALADKQSLAFSVSRLTEKELIVVLTDLKQTEILTNVLKRIFSADELPVRIDGDDFYLSSSIGVSVFPLDGDTPDTLLRNAGSALRAAKEGVGRNRFKFYADAINLQSKRRLQLEADLNRALDSDELTVYYQPKIDLRSGELHGMEALVRWQNPKLGLVPPGDFIPLAEQTGLIDAISDWVFSSVCRQILAWEQAGFNGVVVAVNFSPMEFRNTSLAEKILHRVKEYGIPPGQIEIEITETVVMENIDTAVDVLMQLSEAGFGISVDDFGTGYSSLNYLRRFPLSKVKIDRSFITDFTQAENDAAIVSAIIAMSHSLGLRVVAEGVETEEQLRFLQDLQCDEIQGYLISKPLPREAATDLLARSEGIKRMIVDYGIGGNGMQTSPAMSSSPGIIGVLNEFPEIGNTEPDKETSRLAG